MQIPTLDYNCDLISTNSTKDEVKSFDCEKAQSTNFWTHDEQRKLEKLLHEFPPEAVESQRFLKISKAMGTRTPKQIASRVQKFFKKLSDANLPIPGSSYSKSRGRRRKPIRNNLKLERPTTFFPERNVSSDLLMKDSDDEICETVFKAESFADQHEDQQNADQRKVLQLLKQVRDYKLKEISNQSICSGFTCCECNEDINVGGRWHCNECDINADYCSDCITSELIKHKFVHLSHDVGQY